MTIHTSPSGEAANEEIRELLEGCIRRYRYTGSFLTYVFRSFEYAGRGIPSFLSFSLDDPISLGVQARKVVNVIHDPETNQARFIH